MNLVCALVPFLVGIGATPQVVSSSSASFNDDKDDNTPSSSASENHRLIRESSIRTDDIHDVDGGKEKKMVHLTEATQHLSPSQIRVIEQRKRLRFLHSPTQLINQEAEEKDTNDVSDKGDEKMKMNKTQQKKDNDDELVDDDTSSDNRDANKMDGIKTNDENEKAEERLNSSSSVRSGESVSDDTDIDYGHLRQHFVPKDSSSNCSSTGTKCNEFIDQSMYPMIDAITKQQDKDYADGLTLPLLSYAYDIPSEGQLQLNPNDGIDNGYGSMERVLAPNEGDDCAVVCGSNRPFVTDRDFFSRTVNLCMNDNPLCSDPLLTSVPIGCWDTSAITDMRGAFENQDDFNKPINCWDVSNVTNMRSMFTASSFNQPLNNWCVSSVTDMSQMFASARKFNQLINDWDVSSVRTMNKMFDYSTSFNGRLNKWNVSRVTDMNQMFYYSSFNQPINNWDVSKVTDMGVMFAGVSTFNQPLVDWSVDNVTNMKGMFYVASSFNQCILSWAEKVPASVQTSNMLYGTSCPSDADPRPYVGPWCKDENECALKDCAFLCNQYRRPKVPSTDYFQFQQLINGCLDNPPVCPNYLDYVNIPIGCWNTSSITNMRGAFSKQYDFNAPIQCWDVSSVTDMSYMFRKANSFNQPIGKWAVGSTAAMSAMFHKASNFNQSLNYWDVARVTTMDKMFDFALKFNRSIANWDVGKVTDMNSMFRYTYDFNHPLDDWNVGRVTTMASMFEGSIINQQINKWDVKRVSSMSGMFYGNTAFNKALDGWADKTANVKNMGKMFSLTSSFNQPLQWNVNMVTNMYEMFYSSSFNQPVDAWDVKKVISMDRMFYDAKKFNQCISSWADKTANVKTYDMLKGTSCPNRIDSPNPDAGPWCQNKSNKCTATRPTPKSCVNDDSGIIDCKNYLKKKKKRGKKCNEVRSGVKIADLCPTFCKKFLCTCVDSQDTFRLKRRGKKLTCATMNKKFCNRKTNVGKFAVKSLCPNKCSNTKSCIKS